MASLPNGESFIEAQPRLLVEKSYLGNGLMAIMTKSNVEGDDIIGESWTNLLVHTVSFKKEDPPHDPLQNLIGERIIIGPYGTYFNKVLIPLPKPVFPHNDHSSLYVEISDCNSDVSVSSEEFDFQPNGSLWEEGLDEDFGLDVLKPLFQTPTNFDGTIS